MPDALKKKVAGLPVGVWLLIIVAGVGVGLYIRKKNAEATAAETDTTGETVPFDQLPTEDAGGYPLTGGGPPTVFGGAALRITPETLRIKIIQPRRRHKKKKNRFSGTRPRTRTA